jgi:hypothetical protein
MTNADFASLQGDIVLSRSVEALGLGAGDLGYYTILHEIGHALGLGDVEAAALSPAAAAYDHADWTVMSERAGDELPDGPGALDLLALQHLYAPEAETAATAIPPAPTPVDTSHDVVGALENLPAAPAAAAASAAAPDLSAILDHGSAPAPAAEPASSQADMPHAELAGGYSVTDAQAAPPAAPAPAT